MSTSVPGPASPRVSVILPTFNRARFLAAGFASIAAQTFHDWELVVVDDGSTDQTAELVRAFARQQPQPVVYVRQANQGAYAARNAGLDHARGEYVAFFDSDDTWLPHHLLSFVDGLDASPDVDWIYAASRRVSADDGRLVVASTFLQEGRPRPFRRLAVDRRGPVHVITDQGALACALDSGIACQLPSSLIRRRLFDTLRFWPEYPNLQDVVLSMRALAKGFRLAYLDDVVLEVSLHDDHSSLVAGRHSVDKVRVVAESIVSSHLRFAEECRIGPRERRLVRRTMSDVLFWRLGYSEYLRVGDTEAAHAVFARALRMWPWSAKKWKSYLVSRVRALVPGRGWMPAGDGKRGA